MKKKSTKKTQKKKSNSYTDQQYSALNVKYQVGNRRELIDYDYIDKLSDKDKDWLNRFTQEYIITDFDHKGKKLIKNKEEQLELFKDNNRRNVDIFNITKNSGKLKYGLKANKDKEDKKDSNPTPIKEEAGDQENYMLALLALKKVIEDSND